MSQRSIKKEEALAALKFFRDVRETGITAGEFSERFLGKRDIRAAVVLLRRLVASRWLECVDGPGLSRYRLHALGLAFLQKNTKGLL